MKMAVVGSRNFDDFTRLEGYIDLFFGILEGLEAERTIISGGAKGADSLAERYVIKSNKYHKFPIDIKKEIFLPDWNGLGKKAGFVRNHQIVDACDMVLVFWDGKSKGTAHTIELAKKAKKPTFIVYF